MIIILFYFTNFAVIYSYSCLNEQFLIYCLLKLSKFEFVNKQLNQMKFNVIAMLLGVSSTVTVQQTNSDAVAEELLQEEAQNLETMCKDFHEYDQESLAQIDMT